MSDRLEEFYEQELLFIRRMAAEFARDRPKIADRLALGQDTRESSDPLVPLLVIATAFGFTISAMLVPLLSEFDVATGRTTAAEE